MSGSGPCTAAHTPRPSYHHLERWCARQAAQTRPELPFLYPFLDKRHKSKISIAKQNASRKPPPPRRDSYVRKVPFDPGAKAVFLEQTHTELDKAIGALRALQQDQHALQEPLKKGLQPFRAGHPESPLFKVLEEVKRRRKPEGRKIYDKSRLPALHFNPWANILADRIRSCPASGVRFPVSLLTGFGLVRHPRNKEDVYLLPTELADLDKLEQLGERKERQSADDHEAARMAATRSEKHSGGHDESSSSLILEDQAAGTDISNAFFPETQHSAEPKSDPYSENGGVRLETNEQKVERLTKSKPPPSQTETPASPVPVRLLPHLYLMRQVNMKMTRLNGDRLETNSKQPHRLLPQSLKARLDEIGQYTRLRQRAERESGTISRAALPKEAELDLKDLKWQVDSTARMLTLMRKRVVLATQRILDLESTKVRRRRLQLWSDDRLRDSHSRAEAEEWEEPTLQPRPSETSNAEVPSDNVALSNPQRKLQRNRTEALRSVQTRLYLHFGAHPSPLLGDLTTTATGRPSLPETEHYLPPMLPGTNQHAFPFIPLLPLLGAHYHDTLRSTVLKYVKGSQITTFGDISSNPSSQQPFTLVIKASAWHANSVFREIWQLWRYVGGQVALAMHEAGKDISDPEVVGDPRVLSVQENERARKRRREEREVEEREVEELLDLSSGPGTEEMRVRIDRERKVVARRRKEEAGGDRREDGNGERLIRGGDLGTLFGDEKVRDDRESQGNGEKLVRGMDLGTLFGEDKGK